MVNTRRTGGSLDNSSTNLRSARRSVISTPGGSSSINESESEDLNADDDYCNSNEKKFMKTNKNLVLPRVRELRSKFTYTKYNSGHHRQSKNSRHLLSERRRLDRYTSRKMEDSDSSNPNFEDELYPFRRNNYRLRVPTNLNRVERRSALSLRPISRKNYFDDPHSPMAFNSDEGSKNYPKRKRTVRFKNTSWIADNEMHKMGYPNLIPAPYSEEDSRDVQESNTPQETRSSTRQTNSMKDCKRVNKPNTEFVYYDNSERHHKRRNDSSILERTPRELRSRRSNETDSALRRLRSQDVQVKQEPTNQKDDIDNNDEIPYEQTNGNEDSDEKKKETTETKEIPPSKDSSDSDVPLKLPKRRQPTNTDKSFMLPPPRASRKDSSSSDTSEDDKKLRKCRRQQTLPSVSKRTYSFRQRPPKPPAPVTQDDYPSQNSIRLLGKRNFKRRGRRSSSSSSSSSSSEESVHVSMPPKSPHGKNEQRMKRKSVAGGSNIIPIGPEILDSSIRFSSIGGLDSHIQCLKEMIILPMMYPEVFEQFHIKPPRGVLFHGPPGTGKTMIARALANECSFGKKKVSFFMRKGADLLSKWIGESEKQLRLLFEQASEKKPSIIFFDELDGLIPVRSSRNDQIHASIVSTLLALMDGIDDRGEIIVVGATNRIDSIDPAFRRPGRFDRELYFPLPARKEREEILNVHVSKWVQPPGQQLLTYLAEQAVGYCGSDLRALCTEAVIQSFKRTYPQVYDSEYKLLLKPEDVCVQRLDFMKAKSAIIPAAHRTNQTVSRKLLPILEPLLGDGIKNILSVLEDTFPHGIHQKLARIKLSANNKPAQILLVGEGSGHGQTRYLAPALIHRMEHIQCYSLDLSRLYRESHNSQEAATLQVFTEAKRNVPSMIFIPSMDKFWKLISDTTKAIFLDQLHQLDPHLPILLLATADSLYKDLPDRVRRLFSEYQKEIFQISPPSAEKRKAFFKQLLIDGSLKPVRLHRQKLQKPPPLLRAPSPPPPQLTEEDLKKLYDKEEHTLRELRIFLRDMCRKLAHNRMFYIFTKPVDLEEVPDYTTVIKQPMDLETMMMKVDFHRYECAKDFLEDIELIVQNALEYNPAKTSVDKQIRNKACSLRDYAYTLIKTEMDSDFEDKCQEISKSRKKRRTKIRHLPDYLETPEILERLEGLNEKDAEEPVDEQQKLENTTTPKIVPTRKRRTGSWQKGLLKSNKRRKKEKLSSPEDGEEEKVADKSSDESKENNPYLDMCIKEERVSCSEDHESHSKSVVDTLPISPSKSETPINRSPTRRHSDLMSPSELLDDPSYFDSVDPTLNECGDYLSSNEHIEVSRNELEVLLDQVVKQTAGYKLQSLLDLHSQFHKIIARYLRTPCRTNLPKELLRELNRFKKEENGDAQSDSSQS